MKQRTFYDEQTFALTHLRTLLLSGGRRLLRPGLGLGDHGVDDLREDGGRHLPGRSGGHLHDLAVQLGGGLAGLHGDLFLQRRKDRLKNLSNDFFFFIEVKIHVKNLLGFF